LCINRLIIDDQNFNTPSQSRTHHTPRRRNTVSSYGAGCGARSLGKTNSGRRCYHRSGGFKIRHCVPTIYSSPTYRSVDHHGGLDHYPVDHLCVCHASASVRHLPGNSRWSCHVLLGRRIVPHSLHTVAIDKQRTYGRVTSRKISTNGP